MRNVPCFAYCSHAFVSFRSVWLGRPACKGRGASVISKVVCKIKIDLTATQVLAKSVSETGCEPASPSRNRKAGDADQPKDATPEKPITFRFSSFCDCSPDQDNHLHIFDDIEDKRRRERTFGSEERATPELAGLPALCGLWADEPFP